VDKYLQNYSFLRNFYSDFGVVCYEMPKSFLFVLSLRVLPSSNPGIASEKMAQLKLRFAIFSSVEMGEISQLRAELFMNKFRTPTSSLFALYSERKCFMQEGCWFMNFGPTPTSTSLGFSFIKKWSFERPALLGFRKDRSRCGAFQGQRLA
jgi:hypothetical protein